MQNVVQFSNIQTLLPPIAHGCLAHDPGGTSRNGVNLFSGFSSPTLSVGHLFTHIEQKNIVTDLLKTGFSLEIMGYLKAHLTTHNEKNKKNICTGPN